MIAIRRASLPDTPALARLNNVVQGLHYAAFPDIFKPPAAGAEVVAFFGEQMEEDGTVFLLAEEDGREPAGYLWARQVHQAANPFQYAIDHLLVEHIAVAKPYRRQGVGRALLDAAGAVADEHGIPLITLTVWAFNEQAQRFFKEEGFEPYALRMWRRKQERGTRKLER